MELFAYVMQDKDGLHMRPAGMLVKCSQKYKSKIYLKRGDDSADMKKLLAVMGLAVKTGEEVFVTADGEDECEAIKEVRMILTQEL